MNTGILRCLLDFIHNRASFPQQKVATDPADFPRWPAAFFSPEARIRVGQDHAAGLLTTMVSLLGDSRPRTPAALAVTVVMIHYISTFLRLYSVLFQGEYHAGRLCNSGHQ